MPKITEIVDGGSSPNTPTIEQMRESQRKGSESTGLDIPLAEKNAARNHGTGVPVAEATNKDAAGVKMPWQ